MADNIRNQALALAQQYGAPAQPFDLGASLQGQFGAPPTTQLPAPAAPPPGFDVNAALESQFGAPAAPKQEEVWNAGLGSGPVRVMSAAPAAVPQRPGAMAMTPANDVEPPPVAKQSAPMAPQAAAPAAPQAYAGPVMVSPGGWRENARATHTTQVAPPEAMQNVDTAHLLEREANLTSLDIAKQRGEAHAAYANAIADANKRHAEEAQALEAKRQQYVSGQMDKLQGIAAETNAKVDPNGIWKEKGTGAQVAAAIAIGLGQFAAILTKTENTAAKIIDSAIERNIRAQEANIANKRAEYDVQNNLLARNLAEFGDKEKALLATRMQMYDAVKTQMDAKLAELGTPEAEANHKKMEADIYRKTAQYQKEFFDKVTVESHSANERPVFAGGGGGGPSKEEKSENVVVMNDGTAVKLDEKVYAKTAERIQAAQQILALDEQALSKRQQLRNETPGTARHEALIGELKKMAVRRIEKESLANGQGTVVEGQMDRELPESPYFVGLGSRGAIIGRAANAVNPWLDRDFEAGNSGIRMASERVVKDNESLIKSVNGTVVTPKFARDASGRLVPLAEQTGQFVRPTNPLAAPGFKPFDSRQIVPTQGPSLQDRTKYAPVRGGTGGR